MGRLRAGAPLLVAVAGLVAAGVMLADARGELGAFGAAAYGLAVGCAATWIYLGGTNLAAVRDAADRMASGELGVHIAERGLGLGRRLARVTNRVSDRISEEHAAARTDRLTGVANRSTLIATLFTEVDRAARHRRPLSVAFIDLDHFKKINDTFGHTVGDVVLRGVARVLRENVRASDTIGRYGGEEFLVVLPETTAAEASIVAEKLRERVMRERFIVDDAEIGITVSVGIAGASGDRLHTDELVRDADAAMYSAKSLGRNQTFVFAEPDEDARIPRAPISSDGRARAVEVGRQARQAAEVALESVILPLAHYRGRPSVTIATISVALGRRLGLPDQEIERIRLASLLHDIGKVAVPEEILEKPGPLTPEEWLSVVQHPRVGEAILEQAAAFEEAATIILHHHERYGGHGYPHGLTGTMIPLGARIVAVADAYDAMVQDRPYKRAMSHEAAVAELERWAGTQFDPSIVEIFCELFGARPPVPNTALDLGAPGSAPPASRSGKGKGKGAA